MNTAQLLEQGGKCGLHLPANVPLPPGSWEQACQGKRPDPCPWPNPQVVMEDLGASPREFLRPHEAAPLHKPPACGLLGIQRLLNSIPSGSQEKRQWAGPCDPSIQK